MVWSSQAGPMVWSSQAGPMVWSSQAGPMVWSSQAGPMVWSSQAGPMVWSSQAGPMVWSSQAGPMVWSSQAGPMVWSSQAGPNGMVIPGWLCQQSTGQTRLLDTTLPFQNFVGATEKTNYLHTPTLTVGVIRFLQFICNCYEFNS